MKRSPVTSRIPARALFLRLERMFLSLCLAAFLAKQGQASPNSYSVTTPTDGGPGSLGAVLTTIAGEGSGTADTISFSIPPFGTSQTTAVTPPLSAIVKGAGVGLTLTGPLLPPVTAVDFQAGGLSFSGGIFNVNYIAVDNVAISGGGTLSMGYAGAVSNLALSGGGTLRFAQAGDTASGLTLGAGGGTIDTGGNIATLTGVSGAGGMTVTGNGILVLSGVNNYSNYNGATTVSGAGTTLQFGANNAMGSGNLNVNSSAVLDLNGFSQNLAHQVGAVTNNGTIKMGAGTLAATNYGGGGTLAVVLQPGVTNLQVTGTANLTGTTLSLLGRPIPGDYTVVSAGGGLTGTFSIAPTLGISYNPLPTSNSWILDITADTPFTKALQTPNQSAVGAALNGSIYGSTGDLGAVINQLYAFAPTSAQLNAALEQMSPVALAAMSGIGFAGSGVQSAAVGQRMSGLQAGASSPGGRRAAYFTVTGPSYPGTLVAEAPGDTSPVLDGYIADSPWGFFISGLGTFAQLNSRNGASGFEPGCYLTAAGASTGVDYRFDEHFAAGFSGGYVSGLADIAADAGSVYSESARFGAYGTAYNDAFHANLYLGGTVDLYDTSRDIPAFSRTAKASPSGLELNVDATAGYDLKTRPLTVSPFASLSYDRLTIGSFTEDGAGALDLRVEPQMAQSLRSVLGAKFSRQFKLGWCSLTPYASAGWQHELANQSRAIAAQFASGGSATFTIRTADVARDGVLVGAGLNMEWSDVFSTRLAYAGDRSSDFKADTFNGSLRVRF